MADIKEVQSIGYNSNKDTQTISVNYEAEYERLQKKCCLLQQDKDQLQRALLNIALRIM